MSEKRNKEIDLRGLDPRKSFYMALSVGNLDGSIDEPGGEGCEGIFVTEDEAVQRLIEVNEDYPTLDGFVYHVVPVARVWRGKVRVQKLASRGRK